MGKLIGLTFLLAALTAIVTLTGCSRAGEDLSWEGGTITYVDSDGGFYGIVTDDGYQYEPINLGEDFQHNHCVVAFQAKKLNPPAKHNWGTPVEIIKIGTPI